MALTNIVRVAATTHSTSGSSSAGGMAAPANPEYAYDGNISTGYGNESYRGGGGDWGYDISVYSTHTWTNPITISSIYYNLYTRTNAYGNYPNGSASQYVQIQYSGGAWNTLWTWSYGVNSGAQTNAATQNGTWNNVTGLRGIVITHSGGDRDGYCGAYIYEIQGWGQVYNDIGIRVKTSSSVISVGTEPLDSSHILRIHRAGSTYGIPLLSTSDSNASAVRVVNGGTVYSLPRVSTP